MVNADMCKHDWPGSSCPDCRREAEEEQRKKEQPASAYEAATRVLNSMRDATVDAAISVVRSEAELPGEMPDHVRSMAAGKSAEEIMRLAVRATKASIAARLLVLKSSNDQIAVKVHSS